MISGIFQVEMPVIFYVVSAMVVAFIIPWDDPFDSPVLHHLLSYRYRFQSSNISKFTATKILPQRWKRIVIVRGRIPLISESLLTPRFINCES